MTGNVSLGVSVESGAIGVGWSIGKGPNRTQIPRRSSATRQSLKRAQKTVVYLRKGGRWVVLRFRSSLAHCTASTRPKGIFITTSDFSRDANDYVSKIGSKIVLIDGSRLAELMIEFGVAVATDATYTVKRIDNDFFETI